MRTIQTSDISFVQIRDTPFLPQTQGIDESRAIAEDEEGVYCTADERLGNQLSHGRTPIRDRVWLDYE